MPFQNTRLKRVMLAPAQPGWGKTARWQLDAAGIGGMLYLGIRSTITGTITAPNAQGFASIIKQVIGKLSTGEVLFMASGCGFHYVIRNHINDYRDPTPQSNAKSAVSAAAYNLDMILPFAINDRDEPGLILLQNKQVTVYLSVEVEAMATVATGITAGDPVITPSLEFFTVPVDKESRPKLTMLHTWLEEGPIAVPGAGNIEYQWPRGNSICSMHHMLGVGAAGTDVWDTVSFVGQQNDYLSTETPLLQDEVYNKMHGYARPLGSIHCDGMGTSGLGSYGSARDIFITPNLTSMKSVIHATGAGSLYHIRRELVAVRDPESASG